MLVALLALFVALGGVGYAAVKLPKDSVGPKQLRNNAVTSKKVRDRSLLAKDFRAGQIPAGSRGDKGDQGPPGPSFGATAMGSPFEPATDPAATPDEASASTVHIVRHFDVTLPASGHVYVRFYIPNWGLNCSAGGAKTGLYLDGTAVPGTARALPVAGADTPLELVAVVTAGAGAHSLEIRADCPSGNIGSGSASPFPDWTVLLLG